MIERREGNLYDKRMQLFSANDQISLNEDKFLGNKVTITPIASAMLSGDHKKEYPGDTIGVTYVGGGLRRSSARAFIDHNYFDLAVWTNGLPLVRRFSMGWSCNVYFPDSSNYLFSQILQHPVETENGYKLLGNTDIWRVPDNENDFRLFVPRDPKYLEQLRFTFIPPPEMR
jgi:hypothetical protein